MIASSQTSDRTPQLSTGASSHRLRVALWCGLLGSAVLSLCMLWSTEFQHWFVLPVLLCGVLIGSEAATWFRPNVDLLDSAAIFGLVGVHLFFIAPLLHVGSNYWIPYVTPPDDWRPWLGQMAAIDVIGLILYRVAKNSLERAWPAVATSHIWRIDGRRFLTFAPIAVGLSTLLQLAVYAKFGGIGGYMQSFSEGSDQFTGLGIVFVFSESAPLVTLMALSWWAGRNATRRTWSTVICLLVLFVAMKLFFGGLRGSRGHLIYGLFWAAGIVHYFVRPMPKSSCLFGLVFLVAFMYAYGFYKEYGVNALEVIQNRASAAEIGDHIPRTVETVLLGDLGRADVQAFILYRQSSDCLISDFDYALGSTYVGTLAQLIPRSVWPDRPLTKIEPGTVLLFGRGVMENELTSTFAFGVTGEAMLNFGILGAVLSFVVPAVVVVAGNRWSASLAADDSRRLLLPLFLSLTFMVLLWDTDVLLFYLVKEGMVVTMLVAVSSRRSLRRLSAIGTCA